MMQGWLKFDTLAEFPAAGDSSYFYVDLSNFYVYYWNGNTEVYDLEFYGGGGGGGLHSLLTLDDGTNPHGTTKTDIGLSNVDNTSDVNKPVSTAQANADAVILSSAQTYADAKVIDSIADSDTTRAPSRNSVFDALGNKADLVGGFVPQSQLPSYVDDILEYADLASFPATGETGKIYIAISPSNKQYRWTGSVYVAITNGLIGSTSDVTEGTNLYFTVARVLATVLSGLSVATSQVIASTDTILQALGYLQAQVTLRATLASPIFSGLVGIGISAIAKLHVYSTTASSYPATTGTAQLGHSTRWQTNASAACMDFGMNGSSGTWFQVTNTGNLSLFYPLLLNPNGGRIGVNLTVPTARLHIGAGTATANTAPLKLSSGALNTTAEVGAIEFLTDAFYGTVTTSAVRQQFVTDVNTVTMTNKTLSGSKLSGVRRETIAVVTGTVSRTMSGAEMAAGSIQNLTGVGGVTFTMDTGANLSTAVAGVAVGDAIKFVISNSSLGMITIANASGTTTVNVITIATLESRELIAINTGANTWTIY